MQSLEFHICFKILVVSAQDKVALILSVSEYKTYPKQKNLPGVKNDLIETKKILEEKMGFKVISLLDLNLEEMKTALCLFADLLTKGVYGECEIRSPGHTDETLLRASSVFTSASLI